MRGDDMSANTIDVLVRFPKETAEELKAERQRTGCPTSEFIRRAVDEALHPGEKAAQ
jgi:predicted DNA-binding protein